MVRDERTKKKARVHTHRYTDKEASLPMTCLVTTMHAAVDQTPGRRNTLTLTCLGLALFADSCPKQ